MPAGPFNSGFGIRNDFHDETIFRSKIQARYLVEKFRFVYALLEPRSVR